MFMSAPKSRNSVVDVLKRPPTLVRRTRVSVVHTDNDAAFKSDAFWRFIESRPYLEHIRKRHNAPETNT